tara:strand:- start:262 stop:798 length:537 start_codon:yes stop_codon:yes gene_type:complete
MISQRDREAISFLTDEIDEEVTKPNADGHDFRAKDLFNIRDDEGSYVERIIAGRMYEELGELQEAMFSYDKAAKCALFVHLSMGAIRAGIRSARVSLKIAKNLSNERKKEEFLAERTKWVGKRMLEAVALYERWVNKDYLGERSSPKKRGVISPEQAREKLFTYASDEELDRRVNGNR